MKLDNIKHSTQRLNSLVEGWQTNGAIPRIERDMALDELRRLYDQLLDIDAAATSDSDAPAAAVVVSATATDSKAEKAIVEPAPVIEEIAAGKVEESVAEVQPQLATEEVDDDVLDIDALLGLSSSDVTVATSESMAESVVAARDEELPVAEDKVVAPDTEATQEPQTATGALFAMEDIPVAKSGGRKMLSLYSTGAMASAAVTPEAAVPAVSETQEPATATEQPKRLIDVLGNDKRVLGDKVVADDMPTTPFNRIIDLRKAIGINDKFLMIKDLFGGNAAQYEATIDKLNEFDDLDDCMIYIAENFAWNPDSEGAKLLVSLIERKLA